MLPDDPEIRMAIAESYARVPWWAVMLPVVILWTVVLAANLGGPKVPPDDAVKRPTPSSTPASGVERS